MTATATRTSGLEAWKRDVRISRVSRTDQRHAIHAYYTATPEAPDGRRAVFYASTARDAHAGELVLVERESGEERTLVSGLSTEDSHRAACQQWASGGRHVVYHDVRGSEEEWVVCSVDVSTGEQRVLARERQLGWGQPDADVVPLYGPHWDRAAHRDLDLRDVTTGEIRTVLTATEVRETCGALIAEEFGEVGERQKIGRASCRERV